MSPRDRCDEVIRLIDEALDSRALDFPPVETPPTSSHVSAAVLSEAADDVEEIRGNWGVFYLRPSS